jgi:tetratricopeptide (TPR) repeat protein
MEKNNYSEFRRLFWAARKIHVSKRKEASRESPEHKEALNYARENNLLWGELLLEASVLENQEKGKDALEVLEKAGSQIPETERGLLFFLRGASWLTQKKYNEAIKDYHKTLKDPKFEKPGYAWSNLGYVLYNKGEYDEAINAYRNALKDPKLDLPGHTWYILGNALRKKDEYDEAINAYRNAIKDPKFNKSGNAWFYLGLTLGDKGEYDEQIKAYRKALKDPKYDQTGILWFNLGNALSHKGAYNEAIKAFRNALKDPNFDNPGKAWNNLGLALNNKGEYDEAIKAHRKSLKDPKYDTPGYAWNNLGVSLDAKGEYDKAIKAYRKSLKDPKYDTPWNAWYNLAIAYKKQGDKKKAISFLDKIQKNSKVPDSIKREAKSFQTVIEANLKEGSLSFRDRELIESAQKVDKEHRAEERILEKIEGAEEDAYKKYKKKKSSNRDNMISILRGWSSAVTLLEGTEGLWRGGGYFLKWQRTGIVVDPGFDFLRNFHDAGYHGREIDAVIVTHNHSDHNDDLRSIDDLRYELYKREKAKPYILFLDEDTRTHIKFQAEKPAHHKQIHFDIGRCNPFDIIKSQKGMPFTIEYFPVRHAKEVPNAIGFKLHLQTDGKNSLTVGFTGDCEFNNNLAKNLNGCDLLIAHISQPEVSELKTPTIRKKNHLGYRGLSKLITKAKPKFVIVSEFWAGLADIRIDLVQGLRDLTGLSRILPGGIGLHLTLPDMKVECTKCGSKIPFDDVRVSPPANPFGNLSYLCSRCVLG